jgi:PAS domain S-box-containing protein
LAVVAAGLAVAGLANIPLASWWELGEISINSGVALLALGLTVAMLQIWPESRVARALVILAALGAVVSWVILLLGISGRVFTHWTWQDWFVGGASRRMGLDTSLRALAWNSCMVAAAFGLLSRIAKREAGNVVRRLCWLGVLAGGGFALFMAILRVADAGVLIDLQLRPTWPITAIGYTALFGAIFFELGILDSLLDRILGKPLPGLQPDEQERRNRLGVAAGLALVALVLLVASAAYLRLHIVQERMGVRELLASMARLKTEQIVSWRAERASDAEVLRQNPLFRIAPDGITPSALDEPTRAVWENYLENFRRTYGFRALELFDRDLRPLIQLKEGDVRLQPLDGAQMPLLRRAGETVWRDLRREADDAVVLQILAPLRRESDGGFAGLFRLTIDARSGLYPIVQGRTAGSETMESLLVRHGSDRVDYLSELRHRRGSALRYSEVARVQRVVVDAGAAGAHVGLVDSTDYRGVPVLYVELPVPGTDWVLMNKIDASEAFLAARKEATQVTMGALLVMLFAGAGVSAVWRERQARFMGNLAAAERAQRELAQRLGMVLQGANDGIILFEYGSRIVEVNEHALQMYGRARREMLQLKAADLRAESAASSPLVDFAAAVSSTGKIFESVHRRSDGTTFDVEVSSRPVEIDGRAHVLSIIRDVSQRKQQQKEIERLNRLYRVISQVNEAIVRTKDRDTLFKEICRILVESGQFKLAWIGLLDEATQIIKPQAAAGAYQDYMEGLVISADANVPQGRGPSGTSFREGRIYVCNDFLADPATVLWREKAQRAGVRSSISLPLKLAGRPVGSLTAYSNELNYFGTPEVALLEESANDVSFALEVMAGEEQRRRAEQALLDSQARLRFLVSATPAIIYSLKFGGDFATTFISGNVHAILGYSPEQFCAEPGFWAARLHPADSAALTSFEPLFTGAEVVRREYRFRRADGTYRWMYDEVRVVVDAAKGTKELVGYRLDITARKEAEAMLRAREEIFSAIVAQSSDAAVLVDTGGLRFVEFNTAAHEMLGYTREEFSRMGIGDIEGGMTPEDIRRMSESILSAGVAAFESRHRHRDGRLRDVRVSVRSLLVGDRNYLAAVWTDITDAKRLMSQLRASEEQHRALFESMELGVLYVGTDGTLLDVNPAACRILDRPVAALKGSNLFRSGPRVVREDGTPQSDEERPAAVALRTGQRVIGVVEGVDFGLGRGLIWLSVSAVPLQRAGGAQPDQVFVVFEDITARRRADVQVRKLSEVVEQSPTSIMITDLTGAIEYVNPRFTEVTGYALAELRGQNPRMLKSGVTAPAVYAELWRTVSAGDVWRGEIINKKKTGELHTELVLVTPVKDAQGRPTHYVAIKEDISERKRTEERLRKLSRAIEQAPLSIMITGLRGAIEYVNPAFCEISGYQASEILGRNPRILKSGETPPEVFTDMWATLSRGEVWRGELSNRKKSGETLVELAVIAPVVDESGRPTHYVAIKENITERKRTEEALRRSEELYRYIADKTSDAIWIFDFKQDALVYVSPASERLLGYPAAELIGRSMVSTLTPAAAESVVASVTRRIGDLREGIDESRTTVEILDYQHRDGRIVRGEVVTTLLLDADGNPHQLLGVTRDVTERERAADALRESRDRLTRAEQMVHLGNWVFELATNAISWSDEVYRIFEFDQGAGTPSLPQFLARVHPQDREWVEATFKAAVEKRAPYQITHRLLFPDGRTKYVEASGQAQVDDLGRAYRAIGTVQDVTERRLVEIEMHEVVKQLRTLHFVAAALDQASLTGADLLEAIVRELPGAMRNPEHAQAVVEIDGVSRTGGASGTPVEQFSAPIMINGRAAGLVAVSYLAVHPRSADSLFYVRERETIESVARTIGVGLSARESLAKVQVFNVELEQRIKERTEELAGRNREIQALLNAVPDLVLRLRHDGTLLNRHLARHVDALDALVRGDDGVPGEVDTRLLAHCLEAGARALATGETVGLEPDLGNAETRLILELRAAPVSADEFVVFIRDITERKRIEAETSLMLEKEREVSEMKTRFISVTSHEFRTPMSVALGSLEILRNYLDRLTPPKREELFIRITDSLQRMTSMLDDMLTLSRVDAGRTKAEWAPIHLPQFLDRVVDEIRMGDHDAHQFVVTVEGDATRFPSDPNILHHIVSNLLTNATHYSNPGTVITLALRVEAGAVRLAISDTGIGIPEADQRRIFDPFERGTNVGLIKGSGLGLNIVKRMTDLLGGRITLQSEVGRGTCFTVELPFRPLPGA